MGIARKIFGQCCLQLRNGECHAPAKSVYKIGRIVPSCNWHLTASPPAEARSAQGSQFAATILTSTLKT